jgi:hypothetical protein
MGQRKTTIQTGTWSPSWGYDLAASASMAKYPTNQSRTAGTNYWITGSTIITAGIASFVTSSYGLGPVNTSAKVSIPIENFHAKNTQTIRQQADVRGFSILGYNGVISTIEGYNDFSSSTFNGVSQSYVVIHVSASKANMGNVCGGALYMSLGTTQNSSATTASNATTNVDIYTAYSTKYPNNTTKAGWVGGISPKNR